jgi:hypothetical protein
VTERPILFSAPMVRAILSNQKTQTRRVVKLRGHDGLQEDHAPWLLRQHPGEWLWQHAINKDRIITEPCPYGTSGDRLWVREAWRLPIGLDKDNAKTIAQQALAANYPSAWAPVQYEADKTRLDWEESTWGTEAGRYRHARYMPRWASRILLEIVSIRVERLQDISEEDARAEGTQEPSVAALIGGGDVTERRVFSRLWAKINGPESWKINPFVWVVAFNRAKVSP